MLSSNNLLTMRPFLFGWICILLLASCNPVPEKTRDTPNSGLIRISVEESFRPFMEEQLKVFLASNPKAQIEASYKSEIDCFKDLANDSTRMIFVTRGLTKQEQVDYKKSLNFNPNFAILAYNAVAVLIHKSAKDSIFSLEALSQRLTGKSNKEVVMDGNNLTPYNMNEIVKKLSDRPVQANRLPFDHHEECFKEAE